MHNRNKQTYKHTKYPNLRRHNNTQIHIYTYGGIHNYKYINILIYTYTHTEHIHTYRNRQTYTHSIIRI